MHEEKEAARVGERGGAGAVIRTGRSCRKPASSTGPLPRNTVSGDFLLVVSFDRLPSRWLVWVAFTIPVLTGVERDV